MNPLLVLGFHATEKIAIITFFIRNVKFNLLKWMNSGDFWKITLRGQHIALQRGHETNFQTRIPHNYDKNDAIIPLAGFWT